MRNVLICVFLIVLISCEGNDIKINMNKFMITQENNKELYRLTIASDSLEDFYYINLKDGRKPKRQICLFNVDSNYSIKNWHHIQIERIQLQPNKVYTIENRSDGDCSPGVLKIVTNDVGVPVKLVK